MASWFPTMAMIAVMMATISMMAKMAMMMATMSIVVSKTKASPASLLLPDGGLVARHKLELGL